MTVNTEVKVEQPLSQDKVETPTAAKEEVKPSSVDVAPEQTQEDPNWRAFREARKLDRAAKEAAEKRAAEKEAEAAALKAAMEAAFSKTQYNQPQNEYGHEEETEDQRIEKKIQQALAAKEAQYMREAQEREQREYPQRLKQSYPDFDNMISQENLDYLDFHYPEVSRPLQRLQDGFDKWSDIYHAVKKFVPNHASAKKDVQKADINQMKPKSMSSMPNPPPVGKAQESWRETEQRRAARFAEMKRIINGVG